jgi:hypothetical protein
MLLVSAMKRPMRTVICLLAATLLSGWLPFSSAAKSYSSGGGHSYSSSSRSSSSGGSHSSSSGGHSVSSSVAGSGGSGTHSSSSSAGGGGGSRSSGGGGSARKSFTSSSGKSYSGGSTWSDNDRHSYASGKSYTSGSGRTSASNSRNESAAPVAKASPRVKPDSNPARFTFDNAAARARKEDVSKAKLAQFKAMEGGTPVTPADAQRPPADAPSYRVKSPPLPGPDSRSYRSRVYVPDAAVISTRSVRIYNVFNPYSSRPWVTYHDPYNSLFWWWLMDRSLDDRAWWAYHHRYDMDPARYHALVATDQQLEARVEQLEAQQAPRDPSYVPAGLDRDLMYSDRYVAQTYSNRPTTAGVIAFWVLGVPTALAVSGLFIWLIWFKRWQAAT